ncbi:MAG TPA: hypothetical protein VHC69_24220 [Polyangiaceae bacterium]|nr:hypothetical protein [Polyangiaceae bacterium]
MRFTVLFALLLGIAGCGGGPPRAASATAGLPEYTAEEATIFDDDMSSAVFGLPTEIPVGSDPRLPDRVKGADAIVRVRVATVSEEELAGKKAFSLSLSVEPAPLKGQVEENPLEIQLGPTSPALSRVLTAGSQFVGRRFVLFVKRYAHHGEPELHWHAEGDTPAFQQALERTNALDGIGHKPHTRD